MADDSDSTLTRIERDDLPVDPDVPPSDRDLGPQPDAPPATRAGGSTTVGTAAGTAADSGASGRARPRGRARVEYLSRRVRRVVRNRWDVLVVIAAGGAVGSLGRWSLTLLLPHPVGTFPWPTFTANAAGCLLLGVLMVFVIDVWPPSRYLRPFLGVGVLGGFTTFSTYMLDARALLVAGRTSLAGQYVFGSLATGLAAVWIGISATRLLVRLAERRLANRHDHDPGSRRLGTAAATRSRSRKAGSTAPMMRSRR